jgi:hypothetical protein
MPDARDGLTRNQIEETNDLDDTATLRKEAVEAIEQRLDDIEDLIRLLDALDGDPDLEDGADDELTGDENPEGDQAGWAAGDGSDGEAGDSIEEAPAVLEAARVRAYAERERTEAAGCEVERQRGIYRVRLARGERPEVRPLCPHLRVPHKGSPSRAGSAPFA